MKGKEAVVTGKSPSRAGAERVRPWAAVLVLGACLLWGYGPTLASLAEQWSNPQYSHGYVVPVFALIVLWFRRDQMPDLRRPRPSWWGVGLLAAGAALRLTGAYFYLPWFDGLSLLPTLAGLCLLVGGWPALRWAWPAVTFLIFMLPLPYGVETLLAFPLRRLATLASTYALQGLGLPAVADGNVILIDELKIGVADACSGLGMLMTFFALSTAVAFVVQRPLRDRVVVFVSAVPVGVLMNVLRITATGVLFHATGSETARAHFHDLAGWVMMPLALVVLWLELLWLSRLFVAVPPRGGPIPVPLHGEIRSTKSEIRNKLEARNPKSETDIPHVGCRFWDLLRISCFGLRISPRSGLVPPAPSCLDIPSPEPLDERFDVEIPDVTP